MDKTMNITLNRLPARTWNRLKMNEAVVQNVKVPVAKGIQEKEEKNAGNYFSDGLKVHPANEEEKRFFANIETALGKAHPCCCRNGRRKYRCGSCFSRREPDV